MASPRSDVARCGTRACRRTARRPGLVGLHAALADAHGSDAHLLAYFSPNSAMAPNWIRHPPAPAAASQTGRVLQHEGVGHRLDGGVRCGTIGLVREIEAQTLGATSDPFCATCVPSTWRSASCSKWVAECGTRCARNQRAVPPLQPGLNVPFSSRPMWTITSPSFFCVSVTVKHALRPLDDAFIANLAGTRRQRRLVEHERAVPGRRPSSPPPCRP